MRANEYLLTFQDLYKIFYKAATFVEFLKSKLVVFTNTCLFIELNDCLFLSQKRGASDCLSERGGKNA